MEKERSSFTGKLGFVLAAAGSAVGLGNIWRFPYCAAQYGGGIFLLTYIILAVTLGFTLMAGEIALGRKTGLSAVGAFRSLDKRFSFVGYLASIVPILILPYYCVIGGWVIKYMVAYISGNGTAAAGADYFGNFISSTTEPLLWFLLFLALTALVVLLGVDKGIEKVSKVMMPILVVLTVGIAIYAMCMDGALEGIKYYFIPDFSKFSVKTVLAAMSQMFYSMSLAMGIMITYGSYMKKEVNIERSVRQIEIFDTGIAFFAGAMIIPAVFACNGDEAETLLAKSGPGLMFQVLPGNVFSQMGTTGNFIGAAFFILVFFAALTSSISLMETIVSIFQDKFKWNRKFTCLVVFLMCLVIGLPSSLGFGAWSGFMPLGMDLLTFFDFLSNSVIMPIVAFLTCLFIGFIIKPAMIVEELSVDGTFRLRRFFTVMIKFVAPVCIVIILVSGILSGLGVVQI